MLMKARFVWHRFWYHYNNVLIDSCLDEIYRQKLIHDALYHEKLYLQCLGCREAVS